MKTENEIKSSLRSWLLDQNPQCGPLQNDTAIIEQRIITSLQVMDLILYIEKLSGRRIEIEDLKPNAFRSIDSIYGSFFGERQCR